MSTRPPAGFNLIEERITVGRHRFDIVRPRSAEELIDEDEYATDERLPYWAELWPSGRVLAEWLDRQDLEGARLVELGCGLALPSLVAAAAGASVVATDWYAPALDFVRLNASRAGLAVETLLMDWRDPDPRLVAAAPFDLVVAADVLYEARNVEPLASLVPALTDAASEVVIADPRRPDANRCLDLLATAGWACAMSEIALDAHTDEAGPIVNLYRLTPP